MSNPFEKVKIVKLFASSEYATRNKAFKAVRSMLKLEFGTGKKQLSGSDVLAVWKGLYTWLWMQDKPILHEEVVEKICSLMSQIKCEQLALEFVRCFFVTMNREWPKIDKHRIDKFYMLVRDMMAAILRWQAAGQWAHVDACTRFLVEEALAAPRNTGLGLKMHLVDILLDELVKIADTDETATTQLVLEILLALPRIDSQMELVNKIDTRLTSRLQPLSAAGQIKIDLAKIGESLLHRASHFAMRVRTRKMFFRIHKMFSGSVSTTTVATPTGDSEVNETEPAGDGDVEMAQEEVPESAKDESDNEPTPDQPAEAVPAQVAMETEATTSESAASVLSEQERRVTFGKRYTKKFTRSSTSIPVSVGTVKQNQIKSILKRVSDPK